MINKPDFSYHTKPENQLEMFRDQPSYIVKTQEKPEEKTFSSSGNHAYGLNLI
ncbi:MAG TPA: hypothetical protein PLO29_02595 [Paludibacter sp.]|nr:hypothetical protein [Paludibacter sp.]